MMLQLRACYGETGACTHEKILKNKAILCVLVYTVFSSDFNEIYNEWFCSKKTINNVALSLTMIKNSRLFSIYEIA